MVSVLWLEGNYNIRERKFRLQYKVALLSSCFGVYCNHQNEGLKKIPSKVILKEFNSLLIYGVVLAHISIKQLYPIVFSHNFVFDTIRIH